MTSKSTGQRDLAEAVKAATDMVRRWGEGGSGRRATLVDAVLTDEEFEQIQRAHFERKQDPAARKRAEKSLKDCLEALDAFRRISELKPITTATADACAAFQRKALTLPKNWRQQYPRGKKDVKPVSPNTVLKWSRQLQAAWERANCNAGKKCVRGVVDEKKLLLGNPWKQFTWTEGMERPIRQLNEGELLAFLDYLESKWPGVTIATALAKVCLWSWCRRDEVVNLAWRSLRQVGNEHHFEIVGKWGIKKWFRVPDGLYRELVAIRTDATYVFAAYVTQLRQFYVNRSRPKEANMVGLLFKPSNLGDWFYDEMVEWSDSQTEQRATPHVFRKTAMQYARAGEDINRQVASDARVNTNVMMTHYVNETDEELRQKSNRTYQRILASLSPEVARRYGHVETRRSHLEEKLQAALTAEDWPLIARLSSELAKEKQSATG